MKDFRLEDSSMFRSEWGTNPLPEHDKEVKPHIEMQYDESAPPSQIRKRNFLRWFINECMKIKEHKHEHPHKYRNDVILLATTPYDDFTSGDVTYRFSEIEIDEDVEFDEAFLTRFPHGSKINLISFNIEPEIMGRNLTFTKHSFSMNDHDWDELVDLL